MNPSSKLPLQVPIALGAAVLAISAGGVLARVAEEAVAPVIGFWRVGLCGLLLAPALFSSRLRGQISWKDVGITAIAGLCLALHFWTWIASLERITVMRSVVLVTLAPLWVGLMEWKLDAKAPSRLFWGGVGIALLGVLVMGLVSADGLAGGDLLGDGLALLGGVLSSAYLVIGREVRQRVAFLPYGAMVCLLAAAWLLPIALSSGAPMVGFQDKTWFALGALALGPQLLGHVGFNYAVRYVKASLIASLILLEPVGATLLGVLILGEIPGIWELCAGGIILSGVVVATRGSKS